MSLKQSKTLWVTPPEEVEGDPADIIIEKYIQSFGHITIEMRSLIAVDRVKITREVPNPNKGKLYSDRGILQPDPTSTTTSQGVIAGFPRSWHVNPMHLLTPSQPQIIVDKPMMECSYVLKPQSSTLAIPLQQIIDDLKPGSKTLEMIDREKERLRDIMRADLGKTFEAEQVANSINAFKFGDENND